MLKFGTDFTRGDSQLFRHLRNKILRRRERFANVHCVQFRNAGIMNRTHLGSVAENLGRFKNSHGLRNW